MDARPRAQPGCPRLHVSRMAMPSSAAFAHQTESTIGAAPPSEYAAEMPRLREFASLPEADPRRAELREQLMLAFLPVVEHLARRHARGGAASREELIQVGTVALITAVDRWDPELAHGEFL